MLQTLERKPNQLHSYNHRSIDRLGDSSARLTTDLLSSYNSANFSNNSYRNSFRSNKSLNSNYYQTNIGSGASSSNYYNNYGSTHFAPPLQLPSNLGRINENSISKNNNFNSSNTKNSQPSLANNNSNNNYNNSNNNSMLSRNNTNRSNNTIYSNSSSGSSNINNGYSTNRTAYNNHKLSVVKRSSSEPELALDSNRLDDSIAPGKLFKSKSTRNFKNSHGKVVKSYMKNKNAIRLFDTVPHESMPPLHITNQEEAKKKFLEAKIPPVLKFKADRFEIQNILKNHSKPDYKHFFKAKYILDLVKSKFPGGIYSYYEANFGKKISSKDCVDIIGKYLTDNKISGDITINFAPGLTCAGRITSYGLQKNKPETRKYVVWINDGAENQFLRKEGIVCLFDHEIGTHYYRAYNDGLQVWFADRKKFGLRAINSTELLKTEEGLAALHTLMSANLDYLFLPALLYYLACMGGRMTFEQLFNHMERYVELPDERWKLVTRVKRGISDPNFVGCYARDQSYFEGAIEILENLDKIDFALLMSGKICVDELERVKRIARTDCIRTPKFFSDMKKYKDRLYKIGCSNGIIGPNKQKVSKLTMSTLSPRNFIDEQNNLNAESKYKHPQQTNRSIESYSNLLFTKAKNLISPVTTSINTSRTNNSNKSTSNSYDASNNNYDSTAFIRATGNNNNSNNSSNSNSYESNGALTTRSNYNTSRNNGYYNNNKDQPTPRMLKRNINDINDNAKHTRNMNQYEIKNYINKEIVAKTNSSMDYRPSNSNAASDSSTLCTIL